MEEVGLGGGRLLPGEADLRRTPGGTGCLAGVGSGMTAGVSEEELELASRASDDWSELDCPPNVAAAAA